MDQRGDYPLKLPSSEVEMRRVYLFLGFLGISLSGCMNLDNLGHRLSGGSGEYFSDVPENSLIALELSLVGSRSEDPIQGRDAYLFMEFDVSETYDERLVVFHDHDRIQRLLPYLNNIKAANSFLQSKELKARLDVGVVDYTSLRIRDLTLSEIRTLLLAVEIDGKPDTSAKQKVPTLRDVLSMSARLGLRKPMAVEIKRIHSDRAREALIQQVAEFRDAYMNHAPIVLDDSLDFGFERVGFFGFDVNLRASFPAEKLREFCDDLRENGFEDIWGGGAFPAMGKCPDG